VFVSLKLEAGVNESTNHHPVAFNIFAVLVGCQQEPLACKNWVMRCWLSVWSKVQIICI